MMIETHAETLKTALIIFNFIGWGLAVLFGVGFFKQRSEIKMLKANIKTLKEHDEERKEKDILRDDILLNVAQILSDQNMSNENRKKVDKIFGIFQNNKETEA